MIAETTARGASIVRRLAYITSTEGTPDQVAERMFAILGDEVASDLGLDIATIKSIVSDPATLGLI